MEKEKFTLEDVITEIQNDTLLDIDNAVADKFLTKNRMERKTFFKFIIMKFFGRLISPLKIRITILWNEKEILTYEIPKD